jgi:hypothetical protein
MTNEPPLTLREVALQLAKILRLSRRKSAVPRLLGLLKVGELKAGFEFPGTRVYWIPIPTSYWTGISSHKFGTLRSVAGDNFKIGTYQVWISDFVDEYIQVVSQEIFGVTPGSNNAVLDELKKALSAAQQPYEVGITNEEWTKYLARNQIPDPALQQSLSSGRPEKTSWHHLVPIIAAYMMTLDKSPQEPRNHLHIGAKVHELASKDGIPDLPSVDTIRDIISKVFTRAKELSKQ